jgi:hypothetical protein
MTGISFLHRGRNIRIAPDMHLLLDIESELGPLPALHRAFGAEGWRLSELAALIHMLLESAGIEEDYLALGDEMLESGLGRYLGVARELLDVVTCRP